MKLNVLVVFLDECVTHLVLWVLRCYFHSTFIHPVT